MATIVVAIFADVGGNTPTMLGVAREAVRRGHRVTVLASPAERTAAERMGAGFVEFGDRVDQGDIVDSFFRALTSSRTADEIAAVVRDLDADLAIVDCALPAALEAETGVPTVVIVHTIYNGFLPAWRTVIGMANSIRAARGDDPFTDPEEVWSRHACTVVTSAAAFDDSGSIPSNVRYVGPVTNPTAIGAGWTPPWSSEERPIVLASYSGVRGDNPPGRLQSVLDALVDLPVFTVATTGNAYAASLLHPPANAVALDYVPHWDVMGLVSICVSHGGHGTTTEALRHGVPIVCVPGIGLDQAWIAERVAALGVGVVVRDPLSVEELRDAVGKILTDPSYAARARELAPHLQGDGAVGAVDIVDELLASPPVLEADS